MAREIKTRFVLEGEQKFKSAMRDSASAIKVLNSEEKLAKAQFQQTGDAQKYAAQQAEILKQKIEEQKSAVAAAEEAIRQLNENGIAENSRQMQQWKIRLNDAQTALTRMETDLQNLGSDSATAAAETDELGDSLKSLDKKASIDLVLTSVDKLSAGLGAALGKVKDLAAGLVSELRSAASWADDLATTALIYGMDTETLQRMQYASQLIDTDVETIVKSRQKLEQAMKNAQPVLGDKEFKQQKKSVNEYEEAFAQLGVEITRYGKYRDWEDVFWEAGDALMHMTDGLDDVERANAEIIRDTTAQKLFGKSWRELIPLFSAGREKYKEAMDEAAVVSDEDVDKLTSLDDAIVRLQNQFEALEKTVLASMAPTLQSLAEKLSEVFSKFNEYLQSEEGQQKMKELSEAVQGLFSDLTNADFSAILDGVKGAITTITDALKWLKDNGETVKAVVAGIVTAWMGLKVTEGMNTVLGLINGLKGLGGAAAAKAAGEAVGSSWGAGFASAVAKAVPWLAFFGTFFENALTPQGNDDVLTPEEEKALQNGTAGAETKMKAAAAAEAGSGSVSFAIDAETGEFTRERIEKPKPVVKYTNNYKPQDRGVFGALADFWEETVDNAERGAEALQSQLFSEKKLPGPKVEITPEDVELPPENELVRKMEEEYGTRDPVSLRLRMEANPVPPVTTQPTLTSGEGVPSIYPAAMPTQDEVEQALMDQYGTMDPVSLRIRFEADPVKPEGQDGYWSNGQNPVDEMRVDMEDAGADLNKSMDVIGGNASAGLANGINARADEAISAANALAQAVADTISSALQIASPSRVMMALGEYVTEGFAEGIESQLGLVNRAAERMAGNVMVDPGTGTGGGRRGSMVDVTLYIGPDQLTEIMTPLVNESIGDQIALNRR